MTYHITVPSVTPRREDEPEVDLTSIVVIHRAICTDLTRLPTVAASITPDVRAERVAAVADYVEAFCSEIRRHHHHEDDVLWPIVAASITDSPTAADNVDMSELEEDHADLETMLGRVENAVVALRTNPAAAAPELTDALTELRDHLIEHIAEEEETLFPLIRRYVSAKDFAWCEAQAHHKGALEDLSFVLPWAMSHADRGEQEALLAAAGVSTRMLPSLIRRPFTQRAELVFSDD